MRQPIALALALLAGMQPAPAPVPEPRHRCRFCRAPLNGRFAEVGGGLSHMIHPANNCRYGEKGLFAVPVGDVLQVGATAVQVLTPFYVGNRVRVLPPRPDVETDTECVETDVTGEWEVINVGRDPDGVYHYKLRRPGTDEEPLIVQHCFLVPA